MNEETELNEDKELVRLLRRGLEDGIAGEPPRLREIMQAASFADSARRRSRLWKWGGSSLVAASLAIVCSFAALQTNLRPETPSPEDTVASVIDLLSTADGVDMSSGEESSVAEMLLAWQDAPYEDAISGLSFTDEPTAGAL